MSWMGNGPYLLHCHVAGTEAGYSKGQLLKLLKSGGALADKKAVVVFTTFQVQAEQVAAHLHSHGIPAAAYHAGKHFKVLHYPHAVHNTLMHPQPLLLAH